MLCHYFRWKQHVLRCTPSDAHNLMAEDLVTPLNTAGDVNKVKLQLQEKSEPNAAVLT